MKDKDLNNKLMELAKPYLNVRHNLVHMEMSFQCAQELLAQLGGRQQIVLPAIILHDVGWSAVPEELHLKAFGPKKIDESIRRIHEVEGAKIAGRLLQEVSIAEQDRQEICRIIESHDSGLHPITLEEELVKDADKLWRFGPKGFSIDYKRFELDPREYWKMLQGFRQEWFFTDLARELAGRELEKLKQEIF